MTAALIIVVAAVVVALWFIGYIKVCDLMTFHPEWLAVIALIAYVVVTLTIMIWVMMTVSSLLK